MSHLYLFYQFNLTGTYISGYTVTQSIHKLPMRPCIVIENAIKNETKNCLITTQLQYNSQSLKSSITFTKICK